MYQQSLFGSVGVKIVGGSLAAAGDPTYSGLSSNETVPRSPSDGSDTVEGQDLVDRHEFNGASVSENIDISANGARVGFFRDVANIPMDFNHVEPIALKELGGVDNVVITDLSSTDVQAAGFPGNIEGSIGAGRGDGQVVGVTVNGTAGSEIITVLSSAGVTPMSGTSAPDTIFPAESGDQLVVNGGAASDAIDASSVPLGTSTLTLDGGESGDALFGGQASELLLGSAGNDVLAGGVASTASRPAIGDEFIGPFPSWTNVKTVYGAKGDGVTDDTAALQAALSNVGLNGHSSVVYLPAGTYKISSTLNLAAREHISIVGEDPATTIIKWAGASGGTELHIDGLDYSRFDRLTFDGAGVAGVLVDQSWSGGNYFDTGNQYADDVFKNAAIGIQGGAQGWRFFRNISAARLFFELDDCRHPHQKLQRAQPLGVVFHV